MMRGLKDPPPKASRAQAPDVVPQLSSGGILPPPPEDPGDSDRWGDDSRYNFYILLRLLNSQLSEITGFMEACHGRVKKEDGQPGLGIVLCSHDRSDEEVEFILEEAKAILATYGAHDIPLKSFNVDTIQESVRHVEAVERRAEELRVLKEDEVLRQHVVGVRTGKGPFGQIYLVVPNDCDEERKNLVEERARLLCSSRVRAYPQKMFQK